MRSLRLTAASLLLAGSISCGGSAATPPTTVSPTSTAAVTTTTVEPTTSSTTMPPATGEIILSGGPIVTMDSTAPEVEALLIRDGVIAAAGTGEEVAAAAGPDAVSIPLDGRVVFPGFIDSHTHRLTQRWKWGFETVEEAARQALSEGWVGLTELAVTPEDFDLLRETAENGRLPIRVNAYLTYNGFAGEELEPWYEAYEPGQEFGNLRIAGIKVFIDFDSGRTLFFSPEDLTRIVGDLRAEGWQVTVKAISVQSHDLALAAYRMAGVAAGDRHRVEHSVAVSDQNLEEMASMGIIASIQPSFPGAIWHEEDIRNLSDELGRDRLFRWPDYLAAGVPLAGSPYNPDGVNEELTDPSHVSPMGLLYRSVTQVGLGGAAPEPWMLDRRLDRDTLLRMLTAGGAFATFEDGSRGMLAPGMKADLVVLSADPRSVPDDQLAAIDVLLTMIGGKALVCVDASLCPGPGAGAGLAIEASAALPESPPDLAFDGSLDSAWNAGDGPEQWIQAVFPQDEHVTSLRLVVAQYPDGGATHQIWAGPSPGELSLVETVSGSFSDGDVIEIPLDITARVLRIVTTVSPSWVAWREIEVGRSP